MVRVREFRIVMPMTLEEYNKGNRYSLSRETKAQSSAEEGVETLANEPFDDPNAPDPRYRKGVFTHKILHLGGRVPKWARALTPKRALMLDEKCWNCPPYSKTIYTSEYFGEKFMLSVETIQLEDRGETENALGLPEHVLKDRAVDFIDIVGDPFDKSTYEEKEDPGKFKSVKVERGPLVKNFRETHEPVMCVYKLVVAQFKVKAVKKKAESLMTKMGMRDLLLPFHRHIFCWMDDWYDKSLEEILAFEKEIQAELNQLEFKTGTKGGKLDIHAPDGDLVEVPQDEQLSTPGPKHQPVE